MFHEIDLLSGEQVRQLREISARSQYVDGKISNPHSRVKNNLQMHDQKGYEESARLLHEALINNPQFRACAFPHRFAPPMMTCYKPGMNYGLHPDSAIIPMPNQAIRSDLSCTIFISDPESYEGGALHISLGNASLRFKGKAGTAIVYPSTTLHEVEEVTQGERHVAITFIQSKVADEARRNLLFELNEVAALEGNNMQYETYSRLQSVQYNLARMWVEP